MAEPDFSHVFEEDAPEVAGAEVTPLGEETPGESAPAEPAAGEEAPADEEPATSPAADGEDDLFGDAGMVNPYTGEEIHTKADFLRWKQQFLAERDSAPEAPAAKPEPGRISPAAAAIVEGELNKIRQWDAGVKTLADIAEDEHFPAVYEKVMRGYDLSDAFYLANAQRYREQAAASAAQTARNRLRAKEHLVGVGSRGGGETSVPREVMAEFKRLMPKASVGEIRKFYRKDMANLKKQKG